MTVFSLAGFLIHTLGGSAATVGLVAQVGSGMPRDVVVEAALLYALPGRAYAGT